MPRAVKTVKRGASAPSKPAAKKKNGYSKSEKIPLGEVLTDLSGQGWKIGPSIGSGGFGDIYCACRANGSTNKDAKDYDCVIKIEPHGNGPLFVEMHFYMRNARLEDIKEFCTKHKIKSLGMPHIIGSGSHMLNGEKHRFLVIPRYGKDIWSFFLSNKKRLPEHTVYRLAIQMLDVYQYIHASTYVHADLKGANILLDYTGKNPGQAFLVDFGLACHFTTSDYKPDPRKMHNGTIEYTSRDAHNGVPTRRGDFEILGYNLVHWLGVELPWETQKLLATPQKVQKSKEEFMKDVNGGLNKLFNKSPPSSIKQFLEYVQSMEYNQTPDYDKCRKFFHAGLKTLNKANSGPLEVTFDKTPSKLKPRQKRPAVNPESDEESENTAKPSPAKLRSIATPSKRQRAGELDSKSPSDPKVNINRTTRGKVPISPRNESAIHSRNVTPRLDVSGTNSIPSTATKRHGKTVINDDLTPNPKSKKTYEFNFELDVSLDANVIVNVKRKKKAPSNPNSPITRPATYKSDDSKENGNNKVDSDSEVSRSPVDSLVPRVSVRKVRTVPQSPAAGARATCRRVK